MAVVAACGSEESEGGDGGDSAGGPISITAEEACQSTGTVTWWGNTDPPDAEAEIAVFNKTYPDIKIDFVQTDDALRVLTELQVNDEVDVDIIAGNFSENAPLLDYTVDADLEKLGIPEDAIFDVAGKQIARLHRNFGGLAYDTSRHGPGDLPDTWADLADAKYKGQYMIDPRGVYTAPLVIGFGEDEFKEWFDKLLTEAKPAKVESATPQLEKILTGEFLTGDAGRAGEVAEQQAAGAPMDIKYLDMIPTFDVYSFLIDGANNEESLCFLHWITGPEGLATKLEIEGKTNDAQPPADAIPDGSVVLEPEDEAQARLVEDMAAYIADTLG